MRVGRAWSPGQSHKLPIEVRFLGALPLWNNHDGDPRRSAKLHPTRESTAGSLARNAMLTLVATRGARGRGAASTKGDRRHTEKRDPM